METQVKEPPTVSTIEKFNAVMRRRGLGICIEFKSPTEITLRELRPGAGNEALRILTGADEYERGPDGWCGPFLEDLMLLMLNPKPDEPSSP